MAWGLNLNNSFAFVARLLLAFIFLQAGVRQIIGFQGVSAMMTATGFPIAEAFLVAAITLDIVGGLMLVTNWNAKYAELSLAIYTFALAVIVHGFWNFFSVPTAEFNNQYGHFMKNLSIVGGLLVVASQSKSAKSGI